MINPRGILKEVMRSSATQTSENEKKLYADASLRSGDCDFVLKNYAAAIAAYEKVSSRNMTGSDYALYQEAIIHGLQNHATNKISC
jgi:tetratricopeptide (TPR) repeat protein